MNDADIAIRSCAQSQGDVLDVQIVNNRPYGMVLKYGSAIKWGWHEAAKSGQDTARDLFGDAMVASNELYLPPLSRASVGIYPTRPGSDTIFQIGPTVGTEFLDFAADAADYLNEAPIPDLAKCSVVLGQWSVELSPSAILKDILSAGDCVEPQYMKLVASGKLDGAKVNRLSATLGALKTASVVGRGWNIEGDVWQLADLWADQIVVAGAGSLGDGFSLYAKATPYTPPAGPTTQPPQNPAPSTQGPTQPPPPPVPTTYPETVGGPTHTWTNYTNAGGSEGPTIPSYTTVQIACKLTGFKVADGNTWWYRIAQPGWDNQFYASADAFYNNSQTSGSLHGTPFVDNAVPNC